MKKQAPPEKVYRSKYVRVVEQLIADPGEWYLYAEDAAAHIAYATASVAGRVNRTAGFERRTVSTAPGRCDIYLRYVGGES